MNSLFVIVPYKYQGCWVFDDPSVGLVREPFVCGIDVMLDLLTAGIPDAVNGFILTFGAAPFPNHQIKLEWSREESGGNWYRCEQYGVEGWLCPALFKYFQEAPAQLYGDAKLK